MSTVAQSPRVTAQSSECVDASPLFTVRLFKAAARFVDAQGWLVFAVISLACGWERLRGVASRALDHDELYTYYIAQAPTLRQVLELTHTVDLHPPLSYLLIRLSFSIFGVSAWSCRLPSVAAFLLATALVFLLAKRVLSSLYGTIAVLLLWSVPFTYQADEARPYSLLLCFSTLMLLAWYEALDAAIGPGSHDRTWSLLGLTVGGFGLLLSHVLGIFTYGAFFAVELMRYLVRRKPDWRLWAALLLPAISVLTYIPLIRNRSAIQFADQYQVTPLRVFDCYWWSIRFLVIPLALIVLLTCFWPKGRRMAARVDQSSAAPRLDQGTWHSMLFLLTCFALIPIGVALLFAHTGTAFFYRYGIAVAVPIALFPALALGLRTRRHQTVGLVTTITLAIVFFLNSTGRFWLIEQLGSVATPKVSRYVLDAFELPTLVLDTVKPRVPPYLEEALAAAPVVSSLDAMEPDVPLVANTGLTFLEIDRQGDADLTRRLYLLNDKQAATSIAHDTVFENYDRLTKVFPIRGKVEAYCSFISEHPRFLILGAYNHPQGWLLKRLTLEGEPLKLVGTYSKTFEEHEIYEVNLTTKRCPVIQ